MKTVLVLISSLLLVPLIPRYALLTLMICVYFKVLKWFLCQEEQGLRLL